VPTRVEAGTERESRIRVVGRHRSRWLAIACVCAALIVLGGCGGSSRTAPPAPSSVFLTTTGSNGAVRVTLTMEGPPRNDRPSWVSVVIENTADRGVRWAGGGCGDPGGTFIDATGLFDPGRSDWPGRLGSFKRLAVGLQPMNVGYVPESRFGHDNLACTADLRIETLPVGQVLRYRAGWDGRMNDNPTPPGPATVTAMFPFIGLAGLVPADRYETTPVSATVRTTIEGAQVGSGLAPAVAIDDALADPAFAAFVQAAPEATWINPDIALIDGVWHIGLFRQGAQPQDTLHGSVQVDGNGRVVGQRFE
jgi:hypothetical protein